MPARADIIASSPEPLNRRHSPCEKTSQMYRPIAEEFPYHFARGFNDGDEDRRRETHRRPPRPTAGQLVIMVTPNFASSIEHPPAQWAYALAYLVGRYGSPEERVSADGLLFEQI